MEGFLVKIRIGNKGKQEERYFILNIESKELSFYQQDNRGKKSFRGQVLIDSAQITEYTVPDRPFSFQLICRNSSGAEENMVLACRTRQDLIKWVKAISLCASCTIPPRLTEEGENDQSTNTATSTLVSTSIPAQPPPPPPPPSVTTTSTIPKSTESLTTSATTPPTPSLKNEAKVESKDTKITSTSSIPLDSKSQLETQTETQSQSQPKSEPAVINIQPSPQSQSQSQSSSSSKQNEKKERKNNDNDNDSEKNDHNKIDKVDKTDDNNGDKVQPIHRLSFVKSNLSPETQENLPHPLPPKPSIISFIPPNLDAKDVYLSPLQLPTPRLSERTTPITPPPSIPSTIITQTREIEHKPELESKIEIETLKSSNLMMEDKFMMSNPMIKSTNKFQSTNTDRLTPPTPVPDRDSHQNLIETRRLSARFPSISTFGSSDQEEKSPSKSSDNSNYPHQDNGYDFSERVEQIKTRPVIASIHSESEDDYEKQPKNYSFSSFMSADDLESFPSSPNINPNNSFYNSNNNNNNNNDSNNNNNNNNNNLSLPLSSSSSSSSSLLTVDVKPERRPSILKRITPVASPATPARDWSHNLSVLNESGEDKENDYGNEISNKSKNKLRKDLSNWELSLSVQKVIHPAKRLKKRVHLRELFQNNDIINHNSTKVEFQKVKECLLKELDESQQLSSSFPYLPHDGCSWNDLRKYLPYSERYQQVRSGTLNIILDINLKCNQIVQRTQINCQYSDWIDFLVKKIESYQLTTQEGILTRDDILDLIYPQISVVNGEVTHTLLNQLSVSEDYVLYLEQSLDENEKLVEQLKLENNNYDRPQYEVSQRNQDEFSQIDIDGDGKISRSEWRKWMSEKEAIMTKSNSEKEDLIQQNSMLRKALTPETKLKYDQYMFSERLSEKLKIELETTKDEMSQLKAELRAYKRMLNERDSKEFKEVNIIITTPQKEKKKKKNTTQTISPASAPEVVNTPLELQSKLESTSGLKSELKQQEPSSNSGSISITGSTYRTPPKPPSIPSIYSQYSNNNSNLNSKEKNSELTPQSQSKSQFLTPTPFSVSISVLSSTQSQSQSQLQSQLQSQSQPESELQQQLTKLDNMNSNSNLVIQQELKSSTSQQLDMNKFQKSSPSRKKDEDRESIGVLSPRKSSNSKIFDVLDSTTEQLPLKQEKKSSIGSLTSTSLSSSPVVTIGTTADESKTSNSLNIYPLLNEQDLYSNNNNNYNDNSNGTDSNGSNENNTKIDDMMNNIENNYDSPLLKSSLEKESLIDWELLEKSFISGELGGSYDFTETVPISNKVSNYSYSSTFPIQRNSLPPSINEVYREPNDSKSPIKSPSKSLDHLGRSTILYAKENFGIFGASLPLPDRKPPTPEGINTTSLNEKRKEHLLHTALRAKSPQLTLRKSTDNTGPLSGPVYTPPDPNTSPKINPKLISKESLRLPVSSRFQEGKTFSSISKTKKTISAPSGATRTTKEWK